MYKIILQVGILLIALNASAQKQDSIPLLLLDTEIQIESTDGINSMYNFEFRRADSQFRWLKKKYGWHPLPYFLLGLSQWWRIMPNFNDHHYDEPFLTYMDSAIYVAQNIFDKGSEVEGGFFLSAAHAFKGRLYAERHSWRKAATEGKSALKYLEYSRDRLEFGPEILFGDALYNYYSVWIPENYPLLKPIMMFFEDGDKDLGLRQLKEVANNAFFTRTEAQYFLMRIEAAKGGDRKNALFIADYLHATFPDNAYFHRYYARTLYTQGRQHILENVCLSIIDKIEKGYQGYEANSGRYGAFFLGQYYTYLDESEKSKKYFELAVKYGEEVGAEDMGYHQHSLIGLGEIARDTGDIEVAKEYFKKVKRLAERKSSAYRQARDQLKQL